jgi:hypothetical protein
MFDAQQRPRHGINNSAAAAAAVAAGAGAGGIPRNRSSSPSLTSQQQIMTSSEQLVQSTTYCLAYKLLTLGDMDFDRRVSTLRSELARNRLNAMAYNYLKSTSRLGERGDEIDEEIRKEEDTEKIHFVKLAVWKAQCLLELPAAVHPRHHQQQQHQHPVVGTTMKDGTGDVVMTAPSLSSLPCKRTTPAPPAAIRSYYDILAWQKEGWKSQKQLVLKTCIKSSIIAQRVLPFLIGEPRRQENEDYEDEDEEEEHHDEEMDEDDEDDAEDEDNDDDEEEDEDDDEEELEHDSDDDGED